jgi:hypothetical protein
MREKTLEVRDASGGGTRWACERLVCRRGEPVLLEVRAVKASAAFAGQGLDGNKLSKGDGGEWTCGVYIIHNCFQSPLCRTQHQEGRLWPKNRQRLHHVEPRVVEEIRNTLDPEVKSASILFPPQVPLLLGQPIEHLQTTLVERLCGHPSSERHSDCCNIGKL